MHLLIPQHDNSFNITHDQIIRHEQSKYRKLSYTRSDVGPAPYGNGNYCAFAKRLLLRDVD